MARVFLLLMLGVEASSRASYTAIQEVFPTVLCWWLRVVDIATSRGTGAGSRATAMPSRAPYLRAVHAATAGAVSVTKLYCAGSY